MQQCACMSSARCPQGVREVVRKDVCKVARKAVRKVVYKPIGSHRCNEHTKYTLCVSTLRMAARTSVLSCQECNVSLTDLPSISSRIQRVWRMSGGC